MKEILTVVLGGGRGTRLYPLTKERSKPAVPFGGKYRLVDIPISNSLHSKFNHIYVLTQFLSESLNKHVSRTYKLDTFSGGFVEIMAAEQSMDSAAWFQGTADAVRRTLKHFNNPMIEYILVLSGDHLYKMDFRFLLDFHQKKNAEITIACTPIAPSYIKEHGIMCTDKEGRINDFVEKPQDEEAVTAMSRTVDGKKRYLASMGIYLFNKDVLIEILSRDSNADFGREVIPGSFRHKLTYAYEHNGYWKDIGNISQFYEANISLADPIPPVDLFDEQWLFFTHPRYLPPAKISDSRLDKTIVAEGCILNGCKISNSVVGLRSRISDSAIIEDSVIMGADYYQSMDGLKQDKKKNTPSVGIGSGSTIKGAIIDKNARIGERVKIVNQKKLDSFDGGNYFIREGIVIIPKNAIVPSGTVI